jgi:hypothetical protein
MSARRTRTAAAVALAAAATAFAPLLAPAVANAAAPAHTSIVNGTKGNGLTISNGGPYVVMNGTVVDFHTDVRDLAWNPAGTKAVFVDGNGNLETANANGTGRVVIARHGAGQVWSHPTWETSPSTPVGYYPGNNIIFTSATRTASTLDEVPANSVNAKVWEVTDFGSANWANAGAYLTKSVEAKGAFVFQDSGKVYIEDVYLRPQATPVAVGSEPALSPSGDEVVFVRSVAGHEHVFEETLSGNRVSSVRDLTPNATTDFTEPAFSANGATIAFRAPNGTYTVPANGGHAPVRVSTYTGLAAFRG